MRKFWLIVATFLIVGGGILFVFVMTSNDWNYRNLTTVDYDTKEYIISDEFENIKIDIDTADVEIKKSDNSICKVVVFESEYETYTVEVKDGTLSVNLIDERKWFEYVGVDYRETEITIYLPDKVYNSIDINVSSGKLIICDVKCADLYTKGSTGKVELKSVIAESSFSIERRSGDIKLDACDAGKITIKTKTGDVAGTLLTSKVFDVQSKSGGINVPETYTGGICEITTSTGDIDIQIIR